MCDPRGMEGLLWIAVVGLALALAAALLVMRRRSDELDRLARLVAASATATEPSAAGARTPALDPGSPAMRTGPPATTTAPATTPPNAPPEPGPPPERAEDELLPVGVLHVGTDHRITAANPRAAVLLGSGTGTLAGRSVMESFLDARLEAALDRVPVGGSLATEHRVTTGGQRLLLVRAHRLARDDLVVVLEDVTELRRLQQIRTEFIDNLGHELRTPLSTVTLLAETLAREAEAADVPPRMRDRISRIEEETGHLAQMVNEMLDLARIEGGSLLRLEEDVDLGLLAAASAERLRLFAERNHVALVIDAEPDLPTVRGDESRLGQVVVNLVHNAVKFSPDGGEVRVTVRRADAAVAVAVTDHGIGIRPADRARIFERFYKADRARVRGGGTGLGLAIARHVVEGHGGRIGVESREGSGSTFTFTVPIAVPAPPGATA
jgi:two-component system, OmpR family, phosphate regulon sensor histidine kinase PhoR